MQNDLIVHRVVRTRKEKGQYVEPHSHSFFHFIYVFSGSIRTTFGEKEYLLQERTLIMIPPGVVHSVTGQEISVSLDVKFSCSEGLARMITSLPERISPVNDQNHGLLCSILEEAVGQADGYEELINLRMYELIIQLKRESAGTQPESCPVKTSENAAIRGILQLIEEKLETPLNVSDLAEICGYSGNYFRLLFKEHTGMTPNSYISRRRIARAKELMLYSDLNVTQISERLGYQSIHDFSRQFRQLTGIPPTEYIGRIKNSRPINVVHNEYTPQGEYEIPMVMLKT